LKSLMLFCKELLIELGSWCGTSTDLDIKHIEARFEHEGFSFLAITLPSFASDFQKSLDRGFVDHDLFNGFHFTSGLPRFLGGFLDLVFDRTSGRLLDEPNVTAIFAIRQITMAFGKVKLECSDERNQAAVDSYIKCEQDLRVSDKRFPDLIEDFQRIGRLLWTDLFTEIDRKVYYGELVPKHGPGTTADKLLGNQKFYQTEWTSRLEDVFPWDEHLVANWRYISANPVKVLEPGEERPVQVILVPKTLKTPRVIAREPTCMQYMQQGIFEAIQEGIAGSDTLTSLIGSTDQTPNQRLAREGSLTGALATLDLSEASDRVSNQHVRALLANHPHLLGAVDACRSRKADVPGYGVQRLTKFASMGSALCFPMEAIVFMTVIFYGIEQLLNRPLTKKDIKAHLGKVRTYGDDIIVPVGYVSSVVSALETFGFRVNAGKSYWTGKFRESCGKDYYDGHDITVTRVRSLFPARRKDVQEIVSTVSLRNQLYKAGLRRTAEYLDSMIGKLIPFPVVEETSPLLGRWNDEGITPERFHPHSHNPLVKGMVVKVELPRNEVDDHYALLKWFLKRGELPFADRNHLERSGRPSSVSIMTRWGLPF